MYLYAQGDTECAEQSGLPFMLDSQANPTSIRTPMAIMSLVPPCRFAFRDVQEPSSTGTSGALPQSDQAPS